MKLRRVISIMAVFGIVIGGNMAQPTVVQAVVFQSFDVDSFGQIYESGGGDVGDPIDAQFGAVQALGDVNSDGVVDWLGAAPNFFGGDGIVHMATQAYTRDTITGIESDTFFGLVLSPGDGTGTGFGSDIAIGDFNNDGDNDVAIGTPGYTESSDNVGGFSIVGGPTNGSFGVSPGSTTGQSADTALGTYLASGDINGDSIDDLVATDQSNHIYLFYGYDADAAGSLFESTADADAVFENVTASSLAVADVDGDGLDDILIGSDEIVIDTDEEVPFPSAGAVYLIYGTTFSGTYSTATAATYTVWGTSAGDSLGSDITVGDFNGDGDVDLLLGAENADLDQLTGSQEGAAYLVYNADIGTEQSGIVDESSATFWGENTGDLAGTTVYAGDVNTDGVDDIVIGATGYSSNGGSVYVLYGGTTTDAPLGTYSLADADVQYAQFDAVDTYVGASVSVLDYNLDGNNDLLIGASGQYPYFHATADQYRNGSIYFVYGPFPEAVNAANNTSISVEYNNSESEDYAVFNSQSSQMAGLNASAKSNEKKLKIKRYPNSDKIVAMDNEGKRVALVTVGTGRVDKRLALGKKKSDSSAVKIGQALKKRMPEVVVVRKRAGRVTVTVVEVRYKLNTLYAVSRDRLGSRLTLGKTSKFVIKEGKEIQPGKTSVQNGQIILFSEKGEIIKELSTSKNYKLYE